MLRVRSIRRPLSRRSLFFAAMLAFCLIPAKAFAQSQDAADAARQEKTRKADAAKSRKEKRGSRVYTNEDLKRAQILTPEDHAQVEARKKNQTVPPTEQPAEALDAAAPKSSESLGEVARRFRREKAAREAEQALKSPQRLPLPAELSQPALASPRVLRPQPLEPLVSPARPARPPIAPPPGRRDPFSRPAFSVSPVLPSQTHLATPASPRIASKPLAPAPSAATIVPRAAAPSAPLAPREVPEMEPRRSTPSALSSASIQPIPKPIAPAAGTSRVTVQPGDSLWKLARLHLGKGSRWHDFLAVNPSLPSPDRIHPGVTLVVPVRSNEPSRPAAQSTPATISVQPGDSLWRLAAKHFGSGTAWLCLAQANPQLRDADHIYPGQALSVPANCRPATAP